MKAYDTAYPDQTDTATVAISVSRNEFAPEFLQSPYRVTINETLALGTCILTVSAVDQDGVGVPLFHFLKHIVRK